MSAALSQMYNIFLCEKNVQKYCFKLGNIKFIANFSVFLTLLWVSEGPMNRKSYHCFVNTTNLSTVGPRERGRTLCDKGIMIPGNAFDYG